MVSVEGSMVMPAGVIISALLTKAAATTTISIVATKNKTLNKIIFKTIFK